MKKSLEHKSLRKGLRIGELAARSGKSVRALHLYEQMGLLRPLERSDSGYRLFSDDSLARLTWIDGLQTLGYSLSEIREFDREFESRNLGPQAAALVRKRFKEKLGETKKTIEKLEALARELEAGLEYLESCKTCIPPLPRTACPDCQVPRENPVKTPLLDGFYLYTPHTPRAADRDRPLPTPTDRRDSR